MSVFGGDSWAREAAQRKRRIDDLLTETNNNNNNNSNSNSNSKKLCNGKYVCLVCPNNPILDFLLMLSIHNRGSRHMAAESKLKERELLRQEEIKKRIALSKGSTDAGSQSSSSLHFKSYRSPLIVHTLRMTCDTLHDRTLGDNFTVDQNNTKLNGSNISFFTENHIPCSKQKTEPSVRTKLELSSHDEQSHACTVVATGKMLEEQQEILRKHREKELKFRAAGWKRDGNGNWFREENVEFDSDEEDPNVCLT